MAVFLLTKNHMAVFLLVMDSVSLLIDYCKNVLGIHHVMNESVSVPGTFQEVVSEQPCRYLLVHELPEQEAKNPEARALLQKMLEALKWSAQMYQVQEVSRFAEASDVQQNIASFTGEKVFLFVHQPRKIEGTFQDSSTILFFQSPWSMIQDPQLKRQVWNELKPYVIEEGS